MVPKLKVFISKQLHEVILRRIYQAIEDNSIRNDVVVSWLKDKKEFFLETFVLDVSVAYFFLPTGHQFHITLPRSKTVTCVTPQYNNETVFIYLFKEEFEDLKKDYLSKEIEKILDKGFILGESNLFKPKFFGKGE